MRCDRAYEMQICHFILCHVTCIIRATCNIINTWIIIFFLHIIHIHQQSMLYIYQHNIFTLSMLFDLSNNTQMAPILDPQNRAPHGLFTDINHFLFNSSTNHYITKTCNKNRRHQSRDQKATLNIVRDYSEPVPKFWY